MPNWCTNVLTLRHYDQSMIKKAVDASNQENLFSTFASVPEGQSHFDHWGTKWEISEPTVAIQENNMMKLYFMTAWSPPVQFYFKMNELGFDVYALWDESGGCILGKYDNGHMTEYNYPHTPECFETLPKEFEDEFQLESSFYEYQIDDYAQSL
jgi:hypothetical protein